MEDEVMGQQGDRKGQMLCCEPGAGHSQPLHPREYVTLGGDQAFMEGSTDVKSSH